MHFGAGKNNNMTFWIQRYNQHIHQVKINVKVALNKAFIYNNTLTHANAAEVLSL